MGRDAYPNLREALDRQREWRELHAELMQVEVESFQAGWRAACKALAEWNEEQREAAQKHMTKMGEAKSYKLMDSAMGQVLAYQAGAAECRRRAGE